MGGYENALASVRNLGAVRAQNRAQQGQDFQSIMGSVGSLAGTVKGLQQQSAFADFMKAMQEPDVTQPDPGTMEEGVGDMGPQEAAAFVTNRGAPPLPPPPPMPPLGGTPAPQTGGPLGGFQIAPTPSPMQPPAPPPIPAPPPPTPFAAPPQVPQFRPPQLPNMKGVDYAALAGMNPQQQALALQMLSQRRGDAQQAWERSHTLYRDDVARFNSSREASQWEREQSRRAAEDAAMKADRDADNALAEQERKDRIEQDRVENQAARDKFAVDKQNIENDNTRQASTDAALIADREADNIRAAREDAEANKRWRLDFRGKRQDARAKTALERSSQRDARVKESRLREQGALRLANPRELALFNMDAASLLQAEKIALNRLSKAEETLRDPAMRTAHAAAQAMKDEAQKEIERIAKARTKLRAGPAGAAPPAEGPSDEELAEMEAEGMTWDPATGSVVPR